MKRPTLKVGAGAALPAFGVASFIPRQGAAAAGEPVAEKATEPAGASAR